MKRETALVSYNNLNARHSGDGVILLVGLRSYENLGIEGRFYTNGLKLKHKLQKKRMAEEDVPKEIAAVTAQLFTWAEEFYLEEERAIQGLGKYHLAPGYDHFQVDAVK